MHEGRGGGGASQGAAHLELLSSKLAFPRRAARSTRVVVTRRARLREDRAQGWHGERGCARRGVRGPRAHQWDLARRVPHMRSATGCSAPEGPAPLRLRRAVPGPGAHAAPRGDWRPPHNLRFTTLDRQPFDSQPSTGHPDGRILRWLPQTSDVKLSFPLTRARRFVRMRQAPPRHGVNTERKT